MQFLNLPALAALAMFLVVANAAPAPSIYHEECSAPQRELYEHTLREGALRLVPSSEFDKRHMDMVDLEPGNPKIGRRSRGMNHGFEETLAREGLRWEHPIWPYDKRDSGEAMKEEEKIGSRSFRGVNHGFEETLAREGLRWEHPIWPYDKRDMNSGATGSLKGESVESE